MITDKLCDFLGTSGADLQSVTTEAVKGDVYDLGTGYDGHPPLPGNAKIPRIGDSLRPPWLHVRCVDEDFAGSGLTITIRLRTHTAVGVASGDAVITIVTDETPNDGDVIYSGPLPAFTYKRYLGITVEGSGAGLTAGYIRAWLSESHETENTYKK